MRKMGFSKSLFVLLVIFAFAITGIAIILNGEILNKPPSGEASVPDWEGLSKAYPNRDYIKVNGVKTAGFIGADVRNTVFTNSDGTKTNNAPKYKVGANNVLLVTNANEFLWMVHNTTERIWSNPIEAERITLGNSANTADCNNVLINAKNMTYELAADFEITASDWSVYYGSAISMLNLDAKGHIIKVDYVSSIAATNAHNAQNVGGFLGVNKGVVTNLNYIYAASSYFLTNKWNNNDSTGLSVGGFIGKLSGAGKITNSSFTIDGKMFIKTDGVGGDRGIGGVVGRHESSAAGAIANVSSQFGGNIDTGAGNTTYAGGFVGIVYGGSNDIINAVVISNPNGFIYTRGGNYAGVFAGELKKSTTVTLIRPNGADPSIKYKNQGNNIVYTNRIAGSSAGVTLSYNDVSLVGYKNVSLDELSYSFEANGAINIVADKNLNYMGSKTTTPNNVQITPGTTSDKITIAAGATGANIVIDYLKDFSKADGLGAYVSITDQATYNRYANVVNDGLFDTNNLYNNLLGSALSGKNESRVKLESSSTIDGIKNIRLNAEDFTTIGDGENRFIKNKSNASVEKVASLNYTTFDFNDHSINISNEVIGNGNKRGFFGTINNSTIKNAAGVQGEFKYTVDLFVDGNMGFGFFVGEMLNNSVILNCKNIALGGIIECSNFGNGANDGDRNENDGGLITYNVGGLVGLMRDSSIRSSVANVSVTANIEVSSGSAQGTTNGRVNAGGAIGGMVSGTIDDATLKGKVGGKIYCHFGYVGGFTGGMNIGGANAVTTFKDSNITGSLDMLAGSMIAYGKFEAGGIMSEVVAGTTHLVNSSFVVETAAITRGSGVDGGASIGFGGLFAEVRAAVEINHVSFALESNDIGINFENSLGYSNVVSGWISNNSGRVNTNNFYIIRQEVQPGQSHKNIVGEASGQHSQSVINIKDKSNKIFVDNISQGTAVADFSSGQMRLRLESKKNGSPIYDGANRLDASATSKVAVFQDDGAQIPSSYINKTVKKRVDSDGNAITESHREYYTATNYYFAPPIDATGWQNWITFSYNEIRDTGELTVFARNMKNILVSRRTIINAKLVSKNNSGVVTGANGAFESESSDIVTIGTVESPFRGIFDGNNVTLKVNRISPDGNRASGLFAAIERTAVVKNFNFEVYDNLGAVYDGNDIYVGTIAGLVNGARIENVNVKTFAESSTAVTSTGTTSSLYGTYVGGLVGYNNGGTLTNCSYNMGGSISIDNSTSNAAKNYFGGMVGASFGAAVYDKITVNFSNAVEPVKIELYGQTVPDFGGFIGVLGNNATLKDSVVTMPSKFAKITYGGGEKAPSGIAGSVIGSASLTTTGTWYASNAGEYADQTNSSVNKMNFDNTDGIIGAVSAKIVDVSGVLRIQFSAVKAEEFSIGGWYKSESEIIKPSEGANGTVYTHMLTASTRLNYFARIIDTQIKSKEKLVALSNYVSAGNSFSGVTFKLENNIETAGHIAIGTASNPFSGRLDGGGFSITIKSFSVDAPLIGLFGYIKSDTVTVVNGSHTARYGSAGVYNLNLVIDSSIIGDRTKTQNAAMLVAINDGGEIGSVTTSSINGDGTIKLNRRALAVNIKLVKNTTISAADSVAIVAAKSINNINFNAIVNNVNFYTDDINTSINMNATNAAGFIVYNEGEISQSSIKNGRLNFTNAGGSGFVSELTNTATVQTVVVDITAFTNGEFYGSKINNALSMKNAWILLNKDILYRNIDESNIDNVSKMGAKSRYNLLSVSGVTAYAGTVNVNLKQTGITFEAGHDTNNVDFVGFVKDIITGELQPNTTTSFSPDKETAGFLGTMVFANIKISSAAAFSNLTNYSNSFGSKTEIPVTFNVSENFEYEMKSAVNSISNLRSNLTSSNRNTITITGDALKPIFTNVYGKISNILFVVKQGAAIASTTLQYQVLAKTNYGVIDNVGVTILASLTANNEISALVGDNQNKISGATIIVGTVADAPTNIFTDKFSGIASVNNGTIISPTVTFLQKAMMKAAIASGLAANVSGITYENKMQIKNAKVTFNGGFVASSKGINLNGVAYTNSIGTKSDSTGGSVNIFGEITDANVLFDSVELAKSSLVNNISGVVYDNKMGASIKNVKVKFAKGANAENSVYGVAQSLDGVLDNATVDFVPTALASINAKQVAGVFGKSDAGTISNLFVNFDSKMTINADLIGGVALTTNSAITNAIVNQASVFNAKDGAAGLVLQHRSSAAITNVVVILKAPMKGAKVAAVINDANGTYFAINSWVVRSNEFYYNAIGTGQESGFNDVKLLDSKANISAKIVNNIVSITIGAGLGGDFKWYSNVNERVGLTSAQEALIATNGSEQIISSANSVGYNMTISYFDLDIDGKAFGKSAVNGGIDAEFTDFTNNQTYNVFYGITFKLYGDVSFGSSAVQIGTAIKPFVATFDGQGYQITIVRRITGENAGLFNTIGANGVVKNFVLNVDASMGGSVSSNVGGLAGINFGTIDSVVVVVKNSENESGRIVFAGAANANIGIVVGKMESGAVIRNTWGSSIRSKDFKVVGNDFKNGINFMSIFGTQSISAKLVEAGGGNFAVKFIAPTTALDGWYSNYSNNEKLVVDGNGSEYTANIDISDVEYVISYLSKNIRNVDDLINLGNIVSNFEITNETFEMTNDIVIGDGVTEFRYKPIGTTEKPFAGTFSGKGFTITINPNVIISGQNAGLFGTITGKIEDLTVVVKTLDLGNAESAQVGAIAGNCQGTISNTLVDMQVVPKTAKIAGIAFGGVVGVYNAENFATNVWFISCDNELPAIANTTTTKIINRISVASSDACVGSLIVKRFSGSEIEVSANGANFYKFIDQTNVGNTITDTTATFTAGAHNTGIQYYAVFVVSQLNSQDDFNNFVKQMNTVGDLNLAGVEYVLNTNVNFGELSVDKMNTEAIGSADNMFKGIFNGNGKKITVPANITIKGEHTGLFGFTDSTATIKNVLLDFKGASGTLTTTTSGTLVGYNNGAIENCSVKLNLATGNSINGKTKGDFIGMNGSSKNYVDSWLLTQNTTNTTQDLVAGKINAYGLKLFVAIGGAFDEINTVILNGKIAFNTSATKYFWYESNEHTSGEFVPSADATMVYGSSIKLIITSVAELEQMQVDIARGYELTGVNFVLANNITINGNNFKAIGTNLAPFKATFDGNGNTITINGNITAIGTAELRAYAGLFGYIGTNGTVKNIAININGTLSATNNVLGGTAYAGVFAYNEGAVSNVLVITGKNFKTIATASDSKKASAYAVFGYSLYNADASWLIVETANMQVASSNNKGINRLVLLNQANQNFGYSADVNNNNKFSFSLSSATDKNTFYTDFNSSTVVSADVENTGGVAKFNYSSYLKAANYQAIVFSNIITSTADLNRIASDVNQGYTYKAQNFTINQNVVVDSNLVASIGIAKSFTNGFEGHIDGNNNNITISNNVPLFGNILAGGTITNLNVVISGTIDYSGITDAIAPFAVVNSGKISNVTVNINSSAVISGNYIAGFVAKNVGIIENFALNIEGRMQGSIIAGFVYENVGSIFNTDKTNINYINGTLKGVNTNGDSHVAGLVYRNDSNATIRRVRVWYGAILVDASTNTLERKTSAVSVAASGQTAAFAGVVGINEGRLDVVEYRYYDDALIKAKTVFGVTESNKGTVINVAGTMDKETVKIFDSSNVMLDGNGTVMQNSWIAIYANEDKSLNYVNVNGSNKIVVVGHGAVVLRLNDITFVLTVEQRSGVGYEFGGWYKNGEKVYANIDPTTDFLTTSTADTNETFELTNIKTTIYTLGDLIEFSNNINSGVVLEKDIKIGADIIIDKPFSPIGTKQRPFNGNIASVSSQLYTITIATNLAGATSAGESHSGLFGYIGPIGSVGNIKVVVAEGISVGKAGKTGTTAGSISGYNGGRISNVEAIVNGTIVSKVAGGLVGRNAGIINNGNITTTESSLIEGESVAAGAIAEQIAYGDSSFRINTIKANIAGKIVANANVGGVIGIVESNIQNINAVVTASLSGQNKGAFSVTNSAEIANVRFMTSTNAKIIYTPKAMSEVNNFIALTTYADFKSEQSKVNVVKVPAIDSNYIALDDTLAQIDITLANIESGKFVIAREYNQEGMLSDAVLNINTDGSRIGFGDISAANKGRRIEIICTDTVSSLYDLKYTMNYVNSNSLFENTTIKLGASLEIDATLDGLNMQFDGQGNTIKTNKSIFSSNTKNIKNLIVLTSIDMQNVISANNSASIDNSVISFTNNVNQLTTDSAAIIATGGAVSGCVIITYDINYENNSAYVRRIVGSGRINVNFDVLSSGYTYMGIAVGEHSKLVMVKPTTNEITTYYFMTTWITDSNDFLAIDKMLKDTGIESSTEFILAVDTLDLTKVGNGTAILESFNAVFNGRGGTIIYNGGDLFANVTGLVKNITLQASGKAVGGTGLLTNAVVVGAGKVDATVVVSNVWEIADKGTTANILNTKVNTLELDGTFDNSANQVNITISNDASTNFAPIRGNISSDKIFGGFLKDAILVDSVTGNIGTISQKYSVNLINKTIEEKEDWNNVVLATENRVLSRDDIFTFGKRIKLDDQFLTLGSAENPFIAIIDGNGNTLDIADDSGYNTFTKTLIGFNNGVIKNIFISGNKNDSTVFVKENGTDGKVVDVWAYSNGLSGGGINTVEFSSSLINSKTGEFSGGKVTFTALNNNEIIVIKEGDSYVTTNEYAKYVAREKSSGISLTFSTVSKVADEINISIAPEFDAYINALGAARLNAGIRVGMTANISTSIKAPVDNKTIFDGKNNTLTIDNKLFTSNTAGQVKNLAVVLSTNVNGLLIEGSNDTSKVVNVVVDAQMADGFIGIAPVVNSDCYVIKRNISGLSEKTVLVSGTEVGQKGAIVSYDTVNNKFAVTATGAAERALVAYFVEASAVDGIILDGRNFEVRYIKNVITNIAEYNDAVDQINNHNQSINITLNASNGVINASESKVKTLVGYKGVFDGNMNQFVVKNDTVMFENMNGTIKDLAVRSDFVLGDYSKTTQNDNVIVKGKTGVISNVWLFTSNEKLKGGDGVNKLAIQNLTGVDAGMAVFVRLSGKTRYFELSAEGIKNDNLYYLKWMNNEVFTNEFKDGFSYTIQSVGNYPRARVVITKLNQEPIKVTKQDILIEIIDKEYDGKTTVEYNFYLSGLLAQESVNLKSNLILMVKNPNVSQNAPVFAYDSGNGKVIFENIGKTKAFYIENGGEVLSGLTIDISKRKINLNVAESSTLKYDDIANMTSKQIGNSLLGISDYDKTLLRGANTATDSWINAFTGSLSINKFDSKTGVIGKALAENTKADVGRYLIGKGSLALGSSNGSNFELVFGDKFGQSVSNNNPTLLIDLGTRTVKINDKNDFKHATTIENNRLSGLNSYFSLSGSGASLQAIAQIQKVITFDVSAFMAKDVNGVWFINALPQATAYDIAQSAVTGLNISDFEGFENVTIEKGAAFIIKDSIKVETINNSHTYFVENLKTPTAKVIFNNRRYAMNLSTHASNAVGEYAINVQVVDKSNGNKDVTGYFDIIWGDGTAKDKENFAFYKVKPCNIELSYKNAAKDFGEKDPKLVPIYRNKDTGAEIYKALPSDLILVGEPTYNGVGEGNESTSVGVYTYDVNMNKIGFVSNNESKNFILSFSGILPIMTVKKATVNVSILDIIDYYGNDMPDFSDLEKLFDGTLTDAERSAIMKKYITVLDKNSAIVESLLWPTIKKGTDGKPMFKICGSNDISDVIKADVDDEGVSAHLSAGSYFIIGDFDSDNFVVKVRNGGYVVRPREVTIKVTGDIVKGYAQDLDTDMFTVTVGAQGMADNDGLTVDALNIVYKWTEKIGKQDIYISSFDNSNYIILNKNEIVGSLTVEKAKVTIIIKGNNSKQIGEEDPSFNIDFDGIIADGDLLGNVYREDGERTGHYKLNHNFDWDTSLYDVTVVIEEGADFEIKSDDRMKLYINLAIAAAGLAVAVLLISVSAVIFKKRKPLRIAVKNGIELPPTRKELKKQAIIDKKSAKKQARDDLKDTKSQAKKDLKSNDSN